jgi:hypothetical protein
MKITLTQTEVNEIIKNYLLTNYGLEIVDVTGYSPFTAETLEIKLKK